MEEYMDEEMIPVIESVIGYDIPDNEGVIPISYEGEADKIGNPSDNEGENGN